MTPDETSEQRLNRLEEAAAFAERHAEQLSEQIVQVWHRLDTLVARLGQMESRLTEMNHAISERVSESDTEREAGAQAPLPRVAELSDDEQFRAHRPPHWDGKHH